MREIKFRGKRVDNGEWVYGCYVRYSEIEGYIYGDYIDKKEVWKVDAKTVGQFTGLYDKNGKEIYEGDVIKYGNDAPLNVIYQESCFCYNQKSKYISRLQIFDGINKLEVLGNIHENPELLTS